MVLRWQAPKGKGTTAIFIVVKWTIRADRSHEWLELADEFTQATRNEEGNLFFEWSRSVDNPHQFVLVEAFAASQAGQAHVRRGRPRKHREIVGACIVVLFERRRRHTVGECQNIMLRSRWADVSHVLGRRGIQVRRIAGAHPT